jgi:Zn-dependent protease
MGARPRPANLFGIPLHIDASWFVVAALMAWSLARGYFPALYPHWPPMGHALLGLGATLLLFGCILLHELGHSLVARRHGIRVACVTLFMFGGVASIMDAPRTPWVELQVALAGPLVSLALALGAAALVMWEPAHQLVGPVGLALASYLAIVNVMLIVFNLLPGYPLDGGRVLRAILWALTRNVRLATRIASALGMALGLSLAALGGWRVLRGQGLGGLWYVVLGLYLHRSASASFQMARGGG